MSENSRGEKYREVQVNAEREHKRRFANSARSLSRCQLCRKQGGCHLHYRLDRNLRPERKRLCQTCAKHPSWFKEMLT